MVAFCTRSAAIFFAYYYETSFIFLFYIPIDDIMWK